jgi:hypothetical protein
MSRTAIPIAADHRGYALKAQLIGWLEQNGHDPQDLGAHAAQRAMRDYAAGSRLSGFWHSDLRFGPGDDHGRRQLCDSVAMAKTTREHNEKGPRLATGPFSFLGERWAYQALLRVTKARRSTSRPAVWR